MTDKKEQELDALYEWIYKNPPEPFCARYPSLGHPIDENGRCVACGKQITPQDVVPDTPK